jgi:hypothetical protein
LPLKFPLHAVGAPNQVHSRFPARSTCPSVSVFVFFCPQIQTFSLFCCPQNGAGTAFPLEDFCCAPGLADQGVLVVARDSSTPVRCDFSSSCSICLPRSRSLRPDWNPRSKFSSAASDWLGRPHQPRTGGLLFPFARSWSSVLHQSELPYFIRSRIPACDFLALTSDAGARYNLQPSDQRLEFF